jgi:UDP-N-acetylglucosamine pyrophosphorylase
MKSDGNLKDLLHHKVALTWGISCVYFSHKEDETVFLAKEYFAQRKTPVVFFVCQPHLPIGEERPEVHRKIHSLNEICIHQEGIK